MDEVETVVEFLLEDLELILEKNNSYSILVKESPLVISLYEDLRIIKSILKRLKGKKVLQVPLFSAMRDVASEILVATDSYIIRAFKESSGILRKDIGSLFRESSDLTVHAKQISSFKKEMLVIPNDVFGSSVATKELEEVSLEVSLRRNENSPIYLEEEKMVGCDDEAKALLDKLIGEQKELEVISLVGMAGIGKTTLAKRLYDDPNVVYHFHVRGWTPGPGHLEVRKNIILYNLLSSINIGDKDSLQKMSSYEMREKLYKCLKRKKYFIVIDNVWDFETCEAILKFYFPNDRVGSRILITSRVKDNVLEVNPHSSLHFVQFLSQKESWDLFESKIFVNKSCPQELMELGNEIVAKCKGLPLAIVVISGLAKKDKTREWWMHIAKNLSSCLLDEEEQFMNILGLSYEHLSNWLKPCFFYLGSFPQGYEIPVKKLLWSWIAEGFIEHNGEENLEDVAQDYLTDLVDRSLVIVSKRTSNGGMKTCHIHDLLRDLCVKKAKDDIFLQTFCGYRQISTSPHPHPIFCNFFYHHYEKNLEKILASATLAFRLPGIPDCKCFHSYNYHHVLREHVKPLQMPIYPEHKTSFVYKLLSVLDLGYISLDHFPLETLQLVHLKYLALRIYILRELPPLSNLWNLETFILVTEKGQSVTLPEDIWEMVKLRHLHISGELEFVNVCPSSSNPSVLHNLQSISQLRPSGSINDVLVRIPNLRNLECHLTLSDTAEHFEFPDLSSLKLLETLKFDYQTLGMIQFCIPQPNKFPPNLKKLTLVGSHLDWKDMSIIGMLPNLEVLKIKDNFFNGPQWETSDEGFCRLKFLKLSYTDLQQWTASSDSFPCIEHLVLNGCLDLEEIPSSFGDICTLQIIEVYCSSNSTADSAKEIQQSQNYTGNEDLKVFIYPYFEEN